MSDVPLDSIAEAFAHHMRAVIADDEKDRKTLRMMFYAGASYMFQSSLTGAHGGDPDGKWFEAIERELNEWYAEMAAQAKAERES